MSSFTQEWLWKSQQSWRYIFYPKRATRDTASPNKQKSAPGYCYFCRNRIILPSMSDSSFQIQILPRCRRIPPTKPPGEATITETPPGRAATVIDVLRLMDILCLSIPINMYVSLINECTQNLDLAQAVELHSHIERSFTFPSLALMNRLLMMYVSIGYVENARKVFDKMPGKDFNSLAVMIMGYAETDDYEQVIDMFVEFLRRVSSGTNTLSASWILVCVLKACVETMNLEVGKQIHGWLLKGGYSEDVFLRSSLINFYGKFGWLDDADLVFGHNSHCKNVVVWTARIVNNCKEERYDDAFNVFNEMGREGAKKNSFTFSSVLSACAKMSNGWHCGGQVHADAIKLGLASKSYVQCGLVNMYGKFGSIRDAKMVFQMNPRKRNAACWNAMLNSYIQSGFYIEAIKLLYQMKGSGVQPQHLLLNELRSASGSI